MHLLALGAFWPGVQIPATAVNWEGLNAPFGARCFLAARRVVPPVTRDNVVSDRQWPKKHPSGQQARGQNIRLFVATARIATDRSKGRLCPGNRSHRRRVAPPQRLTLVA